MFGRTSLLKATALALPFGLMATAAHAADIAETVQQNEQLGTFSKAMEQAKFGEQLSGDGPYTVFAPTDQAFEQLPEGALDELMKQENQEQLATLLEHHVVEGEAIAADDLLGQQRQIDTMSGDSLTVDGTSQVVLLVPTGLTIARVGDQMVIEREGVAVSRRAIQVQDQTVREAGASEQQTSGEQQAQGQQEEAARTPTDEESDMPMTEHQQQALESQPAEDQQQTAPAGTADMPATEHQQQAIESQPGQDRQQVQDQQQAQGQQQTQGQRERTAARTPTGDESGMPMTEHQQEVIESEPGQEQQQTAPQGATPMPETEHQREVLAEEELPGEQQQSYEEAAVEGEPDLLREATVVSADIEADNGVIHVIDAVLLPQDVLETLEQAKEGEN